jgi:outer membrane protein OmpA-like peptidoglycan-associated protein
MKTHKLLTTVLTLSLVLIATGCESGSIRAREAGALSGAAIGAGLGAIVGNQTGSSGAGIAIGSAIGALSGGLIGNELDRQDDALADRRRRLDAQDQQIAENRRLIEQLRRGGADARETSRGVVVNLPDVLFEFDSARLTGGAARTVDEIARAIKEVSGRSISVEGHTDSVGTLSYNQRLSESRARSVADALHRVGTPKRVMSVRGFGENDPITSNSSESGRQRNRRVEVIIENN